MAAACMTLLGAARPAAGVTVEEIPSPRPHGWTVDLTGRIRPETVAELNALADGIKVRLGGELAVVVVTTTEGSDHRQFATTLFNRWGIGDRQRNDGVLLFAALDDRAAELVIGDGFRNSAVTVTDAIMAGVIVPQFKEGNPDQALLRGAAAAAARLWEHAGPDTGAAADAGGWPADQDSNGRMTGAPRPAGVLPRVRDWADRHGWGWLFGLGAALAGAVGMAGRHLYRYRPRQCPHCGVRLVLIDEQHDDRLLEKHEKVEEGLGSVDYDIWACPQCKVHQKEGWNALLTAYSRCAPCGARTRECRTTTLRSPTTSSTGLARDDYTCKNCGHKHSRERVLARIQKSSSSSGSSGFGGGSSSGRGSSGRW